MTAPDVAAAVARLRAHADNGMETWPYAGAEVNPHDLALVLDDHARLTAPPVECSCYPNGFTPDTYEGPQPWCDEHGGPPSEAYRQGVLAGESNARLVAPPVVGEALVERLAGVAYSGARADKLDRAGPDVYMPWEHLGVNARLGWRAAVRAVVAALPDPVAGVQGVDLAGVLAGHWRGSRTGRCGGDACVTDLTRRRVQEHDEHQADVVRAAVVAALRGEE